MHAKARAIMFFRRACELGDAAVSPLPPFCLTPWCARVVERMAMRFVVSLPMV
jgi:hypothetical protein